MAIVGRYTGGDNIQVDVLKTDGNCKVVNLAVMFDPSDGIVKPWDTTDTANKNYFLGVVWGYTSSTINIGTGGSFPTSLADGTYYSNGSGVLSTTLGGSSFAHKVCEVVNGEMYVVPTGGVSTDAGDISIDDTDFVVIDSPTDLQDYLNQADTALLNTMNTGVRFGGIPSVDGGVGVGTTVSVTAGEGSILDITDAENPTYTTITWGAQSTISLDTTSPNITYWYFDDNSGVIKQSTTRPTFPERKGAIYLFRTVYNAGAISALGSEITQLQHTATAISAISEVLGPVNLFGNEPTNSSTNLELKITSGKVYDYGANYFNSYIDPHAVSFATFDTGVSDTFRYAIQTGTINVDETDIDVANYNNAGVVTAIPGSSMRVGIHFIFRFSDTGNVRLAYGSDWYQDLDDALAAISSLDPRETVTAGFSNAQLLGAIIVSKGETDLSNATFITANKFGELSGGSISTGGGSYLEIANNLSDLASASTARTNLDVYSTDEVDGLVAPIGSGFMWYTNSAPTNYLICDGSAVSRATYADLFTLIGTTYGVGDGSTTFNLPDLRQRFPLGKAASGTGSTLAATGGEIDHTHEVTTGQKTVGILSLLATAAPDNDTIESTENNPPYLVVNYIIKAL